jgi:Zn-dependent protease
MKGSWRIGTFAGIPVDVHWTFFLLFLWVAYAGAGSSLGWTAIAMESAFLVALFFCVVLHEFGHALTARRFGVQTKDIILSPIGGVARLERLPEKPIHEFYIAIAGPLVNVVIALLLAPYFFFFDIERLFKVTPEQILSDFSFFIPWLLFTNLLLAVFNLVPAFPMDGGRIFRSLLAIRLGRLRATRAAAITGQVIAVGFFGLSLYTGGLVLSFIAIFVFFMATQEYRMVKVDELLKNVQVREIMQTDFTVFPENHSMDEPIRQLQLSLSSEGGNFLTTDQWGMYSGTLTRSQIIKAIQEEKDMALVSDYASKKLSVVRPDDNLSQVWMLFQKEKTPLAGVWEAGEIIGVINQQMIENYLKLQEQLGARGRRFFLSGCLETKQSQQKGAFIRAR